MMCWWRVESWFYRVHDYWFARNASEEDRRIIRCQDDQTLAKWSAQLNCFDWPKELPHPEPTRYISGGRRSQLRDIIQNQIGAKEISRFWNCVYQGSMSPEQFEFWWANGHEEFHAKWPEYRSGARAGVNRG